MRMLRTYSELIQIPSFRGRYEYLRIGGKEIGVATFGSDRWINQILYTSRRWINTRNKVILRDNGCNLGHPDFPIPDAKKYGAKGSKAYDVVVHHMNPITLEDVELERDIVYDPEYLITVNFDTHNAIHYGNERILPAEPVIRRKGDTSPWLNQTEPRLANG